LFCSNLNTLELVYSDAAAAVALHEDWAVRGHAMVIAREHVENLSDLADLDAFMRVYRAAERALIELTGADRAMILKLGIVTPHLHLHIYPVTAALDRASVMAIIDARVREQRDSAFVDAVRRTIGSALSSH